MNKLHKFTFTQNVLRKVREGKCSNKGDITAIETENVGEIVF